MFDALVDMLVVAVGVAAVIAISFGFHLFNRYASECQQRETSV